MTAKLVVVTLVAVTFAKEVLPNTIVPEAVRFEVVIPP